MVAPLKIIHVLRAPVGGLFRHVLDLAEGQAQRGHGVGIIAATGGGEAANQRLAALSPHLALGIHRIEMSRQPGLSDLEAVRATGAVVDRVMPEVLHGHGAKGGAYARLARAGRAIRVYTPHGGSLHYSSRSPAGIVFGLAERLMARRTDLLLFESEFAKRAFTDKFGAPPTRVAVVPNGVTSAEFEPVEPQADAADLLAIGELRHLKGVDVLIEAIAALHRAGRPVTATIVGEGPDGGAFRDLVEARGLGGAIHFAGFRPARVAFAMGRILVVASRAESLPYVVLEAGAAGRPMIATNVGGIPEIFGGAESLLPPGDATALASAIGRALDDPDALQRRTAATQTRIRASYSQDSMVEAVLAAYENAGANKFQRSH